MYRPADKRQQGGDYSTTAGTMVSQDTMDLIGELANVKTFSQMKSFLELNSLSPLDVSQLIDTLGEQVIQESTGIVQDRSSIVALDKLINAPTTGLLDIYNLAADNYSTGYRNYYASIDTYCTTIGLIADYTATICSLSTQDYFETSSLEGYNALYSSLHQEIQKNYDDLNGEISIYNSLIGTRDHYKSQYDDLYNNYSTLLTTVLQDEHSLSTAYHTYINTLQDSDHNYLSTISSVYTNDFSTSRYISTLIFENTVEQGTLESYIKDAVIRISSLSFYSSLYGTIGLEDEYFSTMETTIQSSINGYITIQGILYAKIGNLNEVYTGMKGSVKSNIDILNAGIPVFYRKALTNLQNKLLSYQYQIEEWSAFVGYLVCQLLIQKTYIGYQITGQNLESFNTLTTPQNTPTTAVLRPLAVQIQNIINNLNSLDLSFNSIMGICSSEATEVQKYISAAEQMAYIEVKVITQQTTLHLVSNDYSNYQRDLINSKTQIDSHRGRRLEQMSAIMNVITPQLAKIQSLITAPPPGNIVFSYAEPDAVSTDNTPFANDPTVYQIFPPLVEKPSMQHIYSTTTLHVDDSNINTTTLHVD